MFGKNLFALSCKVQTPNTQRLHGKFRYREAGRLPFLVNLHVFYSFIKMLSQEHNCVILLLIPNMIKNHKTSPQFYAAERELLPS